jgi:CRP-like cAMP-binding protein
MRCRQVPAGEAVYALGSPPDACYMIRRGRVRICNFTESGREVSMGELLEGDCLGEIGIIDGLPRFNTAIASEDSELLMLARPDFDRLYRAHPEIARQLNRQLAYRVRLMYMHAEEANSLSLAQRLARTLARIGYSAGEPQESGEILVRPLSHEALANMLGASRQAVSQEMKQLERTGLVRISYGKVYIRDIETLIKPVETLIGGEPVVSAYRTQPRD